MIRKVQTRLQSDFSAARVLYRSKTKLADLGVFASPMLTQETANFVLESKTRPGREASIPSLGCRNDSHFRKSKENPAVFLVTGGMLAFKRINFRAMAALLVAAVAFGCSPEAKRSGLLKRADQYFASGEYDKAKIEYLNLLRADPQNATAISRLGAIWFEQGAPLNAAPFLLKARDLVPDNLEARTKLALVFMSVGQFAEARNEALAILDRSPDHDEAMLLLAESSQNQGEIDAAEQRLKSLNADDKAGVHLALAALALRRQDLASAESEVTRAVSLDPNSVAAHLALGKLYWVRNDLTKADQEFKAAAELAPVRSAARLNYAQFKARTGALPEAKAQLNEVTREAPDSLPAWRLLAQLAFTEGKLDESLQLLENITLRDPANVEARLLQAQVWMAKGEVKKALENLEGLNARLPESPPIKFQLARAYLQDRNVSQARAVLNQAITANPDYAEAILLLGEINLRSGDAQAVVAPMVELLKKRPGLVQAQVLLAQAYQALGQLDDATAVFREQIKASPQSSQPHFLLALVLREQNKIDEARQAFESVQRLAPDNLLAFGQLVDLDIQSKDFDAALERVRTQLKKTPESAGVHFMEGKVYAAQSKWDYAQAALLRALELDPNSSSTYYLLLSTYLAANKLPQAIALLEDLLSRSPDHAPALVMLALIFERINDFPKAREAYLKLLAVKPDSVHALNNLAYLYAERLGEPDKAYDLAQRARALEPASPAVADTLGWIFYQRGEYKQALELIKESALKLPGNPEIQFHLGMASYMMGDMDSARMAFGRANSATGEFPGKEEAKRRLSMLGDDGANAATERPIDELEAILKQQPDDVVTRMLLGETYEKHGDFAEAAKTYEEALRRNPKLLSATTKLAQLNAGPLQSDDKALEFARKARELAPNDPKIIGILGSAAYQTANFAWAYSLLQESNRQLPNDAGTLHDLAWAAYSLGKVSEARQTMQRVLTANPDSSQASDAKLFLAMTDQDGTGLAGESDIEKALQTNPKYVPALMAKGEIFLKRGESEAAATNYIEILSQLPDFAPAQKRLASLYLETPNKREAYDLAVKARRTLSDDPELAQILAELSYQRKEFAYAVQLLQQSAKKKPLDAKSLYYLGMSHLEAKDQIQSREALDQALAAGLEDPLASEAKRVLTELGKN
jgi:tetratricopeptide (TPR) repeat protein